MTVALGGISRNTHSYLQFDEVNNHTSCVHKSQWQKVIGLTKVAGLPISGEVKSGSI